MRVCMHADITRPRDARQGDERVHVPPRHQRGAVVRQVHGVGAEEAKGEQQHVQEAGWSTEPFVKTCWVLLYVCVCVHTRA
jgi:hypothetical protein